MATQNVKILLRRGLREQLTSDILDTGELGFTTDTNQLFIGIDSAINEIQFDPFVNAHAVIQAWLDSEECPYLGLQVDEDLVIRDIPTDYDDDGTPISGVQAILDAMQFFIQEVVLVGDFQVNAGDTIYQRRFVYADVEADVANLEALKTYKILETTTDADNFINNAAGTVEVSYTKYNNFTVRRDYNDTNLGNQFDVPSKLRLVEVIDTIPNTSGVVSVEYDYQNAENNISGTRIIVRLREGDGEFTLDNPYVENYYHFNGTEDGKLKTDFGLFRQESVIDYDNIVMRVWRLQSTGPNAWDTVDLTLLTDAPGTGNVETVNEAGIAYPVDTYGDDYEYAAVTSGDIKFFQKVGGSWVLLAGRSIVTGELFVSDDEPTSPELGDYWVTLPTLSSWVKQEVSTIDESNYPDSIEVVEYNSIELDKPLQVLYSDIDVEDHVVVTKSSKVTYWMRDADLLDWALIGSEKYETGNITLTPDSSIHTIDPLVVQSHNNKPGGYWKVILTRGAVTEELSYGTDYTIWLDDPALSEGQIIIPPEIDTTIDLDTVEIRYYYHNDFQFSTKPPYEYTNQSGTFATVTQRSNGDPIIGGDYYVYTDKDIFGGTDLNIFQWKTELITYEHDTVPFYYSDAYATASATAGVLLYAAPYTAFKDADDNDIELNVGVFELRQRDYDTSEFWYPYDYDDLQSYYFSTNPIASVSEDDFAHAYSISGKSTFSVGHLGRARRNVEVVTENTFNQLFADQHLSAEYEYTGMRPSLYRKHLDGLDGVFLKYDKNVCTTFFVDYSLKQTVGSKVFLRVGQLKIINGYPHDIPEIKITDENTEIWHDTLATGDADTIEDYDEFSNIVFETAVQVDENDFETNNLLIIYRQDPGCNTEISYTLKRWTM